MSTETSSDAHAIDILCDLVATPSVSNNESAAVTRFAQHARALGLSAEIDEAGSGIATRSSADPRSGTPPTEIVLLGHIDTVPGDIPVRIEPDPSGELMLHGRGSVDAKGPLAAMLVAAARATLPPNITLHICAAVGEETPHSRGARHIARSLRPHACIIGEPSGWDGVTLGYKGRLVVTIDIAQPCHHSAGPGDSAPDAAHALWTRILTQIATLNAANNPAAGSASPRAFDIIQSSLRSLSSSSDGLTDRARIVGGFRLPRWISPHDLETHIRALSPDSTTITLTFEGHETAHAVDRNDPVARALSAAIRAESATPRPKLKTGTADLNVVAPIWNCPIAAYGPGDSSLDHTPVERLAITDYLRSIRVLTGAIESLARELASATTPASIIESRPLAPSQPGARA